MTGPDKIGCVTEDLNIMNQVWGGEDTGSRQGQNPQSCGTKGSRIKKLQLEILKDAHGLIESNTTWEAF